ncbi:uncharacterized protein [Hyperolius riggenbachi]|uniref:uncharacterized protein isoform X2 n=1 Tax=Hyperolius riggenbachi TaxID=752182 RepID=UPI0035A2A52E
MAAHLSRLKRLKATAADEDPLTIHGNAPRERVHPHCASMQETSDLSDSSNRSRSCLVCKVVLPTSWTKASCQGCITKLINEENTASCKEFDYHEA